MYVTKEVLSVIDLARLDAIDKYSNHLIAEISLAQNGDGFFDKKYWYYYLSTKYQCQEAQNKFQILLHELSK